MNTPPYQDNSIQTNDKSPLETIAFDCKIKTYFSISSKYEVARISHFSLPPGHHSHAK